MGGEGKLLHLSNMPGIMPR